MPSHGLIAGCLALAILLSASSAQSETLGRLLLEAQRHNDEVRQYFAGSGRLLEMNLEQGDGWPELCPFLDRPIPGNIVRLMRRHRLHMRHHGPDRPEPGNLRRARPLSGP